jgi:hypothetical protein
MSDGQWEAGLREEPAQGEAGGTKMETAYQAASLG